MALIKCPECGNEVSSAAMSCPKCGYPIAKGVDKNSSEDTSPNSTTNSQWDPANEAFPSLPIVLNVGKHIREFGFPTIEDAYYIAELNNTNYIKEGKVSVSARTNGISIHSGLDFFLISKEQIIEMKSFAHKELTSGDKSIIGRAAAGWLLLGPAGAVVGGLTGLGAKKAGDYLLSITYWDVYSRNLQTLLVCTKKHSSDFIKRIELEWGKGNAAPDSDSYICNILDDSGKVSDTKAIEALKVVGEFNMTMNLQHIYGCDISFAKSQLKDICERNNIDKSQYKSPGCMITLLLTITGLLSLVSFIFVFE